MKKLITAISLLLIITMLPLSLFSCNGGEETLAPTQAPTAAPTEKPTDTQKPTEKPTEKPTDPTWDPSDYEEVTLDFSKSEDVARVKKIGRYVTSNKIGIGCDMTASGIEFSGTMYGDVVVAVKCSSVRDTEAYLTVLVDGERIEQDTYKNGKRSAGAFYVKTGERLPTELTVASFDEPGEHTITVLKQTESGYSLIDFRSVTINGSFSETAPANKDLYIEFIGDSLTCAMGSAGNNTISGGGSAQGINGADWEDGTLGYAYLTAKELGADWSIISESGIGITHTWFSARMPEFYLRTSYNRFQSTEYDFERVPDFIVINLGTNDHYLRDVNGHKDHYVGDQVVRRDTKAFIETIREKYGEQVPIVWVSGVWNIDSGVTMQEVDQAIADLGGEDAKIYRLKLPNNDENRKGAEAHPSAAGHIDTKNKLIEFLKTKGLVD